MRDASRWLAEAVSVLGFGLASFSLGAQVAGEWDAGLLLALSALGMGMSMVLILASVLGSRRL